MVRVRERLLDAQELKRRVRNQFLSVPFHDGTIGAYGPRTARVKVGYVSFTRNKLSEPYTYGKEVSSSHKSIMKTFLIYRSADDFQITRNSILVFPLQRKPLF